MKRIKLNDTVIVTTGKSKGKVGKVLRVNGDSVIVEGCQLIKKHVKPNPQINEEGGVKIKESPIHISNVAMYIASEDKASKVGFKFIDKEDGKKHKVRYFKANNELVDLA
jgi:large subunit ribosomal protein L24